MKVLVFLFCLSYFFQINAQTKNLDSIKYVPIFPIINDVFKGRVDYEYWIPQKQLPLKTYENLLEGSFLVENIAPSEKLNYKNGLLDGHYIFYWDNGNPQFELTVKEGLAQDIHRQWYENGELFIETYLNDSSLSLSNLQKEAGQCQIYITESGALIYSYSYEDHDPLLPDLRMGVYEEVIYSPSFDGLYKCYWPNATLMEKSYYVNGKKVGYAYYYDETGALTAFAFYDKDGFPISYGVKQPDGSIKGYTIDDTD